MRVNGILSFYHIAKNPEILVEGQLDQTIFRKSVQKLWTTTRGNRILPFRK